jgi:putative transposase
VLLQRAFRYQIYPTPEQVARLGAWDGALRFLWNIALEQRLWMQGRCGLDKRYPTAFDQINELTELRAMLPWLAQVPRNVCAQVLVELDAAWQRCFKGLARAPRFKRKGRDRAPMIEPHPKLFRVEGTGRAGAVVFPKLGALHAVIHRPLQGTPKRCAIVKDGDAWYVAVTCEIEVDDPIPSSKPPVAIDRGVASLLADSNRRAVENPRPLERLQPRLRRAQRTVARRQKGSKNQQKARAKVARLQRKAARRRAQVLHVESHRYTKSHGAVIVEKLVVRNMTRSARGTVEEPGTHVAQKAGLNRAILDSGWGRFVEMLRYKVVPEGGRVVEVTAAYSSQSCGACGAVDPASRREQSVFLCTACGHLDNADLNAAQVLLARGKNALAVEATATGCGGIAARGRPAKQQLRVVRRGTRSGKGAVVATTKAPDFSQG